MQFKCQLNVRSVIKFIKFNGSFLFLATFMVDVSCTRTLQPQIKGPTPKENTTDQFPSYTESGQSIPTENTMDHGSVIGTVFQYIFLEVRWHLETHFLPNCIFFCNILFWIVNLNCAVMCAFAVTQVLKY